ncbi:MAG: GDP-mannose 4,6-dehydratase [Gammaproteobacteria bacterium]|nr:GDP-mannose 4,6-dehydratase [Gammaproteobacteria bacterium]MBU1415559.1 GDP-mannose 4,6-dehydratase [Gammaproteobacteria bacterium]
MTRARRALITGIDGFTGRYLKVELESTGWEVFGIGMSERFDGGNYHQIDLADVESLRRLVAEVQPDAVAHLAGIAFVGHGDANAIYRVNLIGSRNLLEVLAGADKVPEAVLLASSANVYGDAAEGVLNEDAPLNPANDYAVSKLAMEYAASLWMSRLPIVIVRPFNYTGVGQGEQFLLPKIVAHFTRRANVIELGNLDVWRDFSDVRSVANAYRRLLEHCPAGETLNVCSGMTRSLREVMSMAGSITGHSMRVEVNPAFVRRNEVRSLCGDPAKLRRLIGAWDTPPLEETLRWMLGATE